MSEILEPHPDSIEDCVIGCSNCTYTYNHSGDAVIEYCICCCEVMLDWVWEEEF